MGQVATLGDVIEGFGRFDSEDTIYAAEPWAEQSEALVAREPDVGGLPPEASDAGMKYFLEVGIAQDFVEGWLASFNEPPTPSAICTRLIDYAVNDA